MSQRKIDSDQVELPLVWERKVPKDDDRELKLPVRPSGYVWRSQSKLEEF